jgi:hypothetical protein
MFTFQNGLDSISNKENKEWKQDNIYGIDMSNPSSKFSISVSCEEKTAQFYSTNFVPEDKKHCETLWSHFSNDGKVPVFDVSNGTSLGGALVCKLKLEAKSSTKLVFTLSWDIPQLSFSGQKDVKFSRKYTEFIQSVTKIIS